MLKKRIKRGLSVASLFCLCQVLRTFVVQPSGVERNRLLNVHVGKVLKMARGRG